MKIENDYPKFYIIAETKLNNQSLENCIQNCETLYEKQWFTNWKKKNINTVCSDAEKFLEMFNFILCNDDHNVFKNCLEFNKYVQKNDINFYSEYLKNIFVTVVFVDTSFIFISELKNFNGFYKINDVNIKKINFWLPSILDNEKNIAYEIGETLVNFVDSIKHFYNNLLEQYKDTIPINKINEFLNYVLPKATTYTSVVSGSLYDWKEFIVNKTQFECPDEMRYVLMHLLRSFKMKWPTLCDDIMLCDCNGTIYSIDSLITNDSSYQKFCVKRVM